MDSTEKKLRALFDYQKFENEPILQGVIDNTMSDSSKIRRLSGDELEYVAAGRGRSAYSSNDYKNAGVIINSVNGKNTYSAMLDGKLVEVNENVANGMVDCYNIAGGERLTDRQLRDLIAQS